MKAPTSFSSASLTAMLAVVLAVGLASAGPINMNEEVIDDIMGGNLYTDMVAQKRLDALLDRVLEDAVALKRDLILMEDLGMDPAPPARRGRRGGQGSPRIFAKKDNGFGKLYAGRMMNQFGH